MATIDTQTGKVFNFTHDGQNVATRKPFAGDAWYKLDSGSYAYLYHASDAQGIVVKDVVYARPMFAKIA
jgi:hypothetical protein